MVYNPKSPLPWLATLRPQGNHSPQCMFFALKIKMTANKCSYLFWCCQHQLQLWAEQVLIGKIQQNQFVKLIISYCMNRCFYKELLFSSRALSMFLYCTKMRNTNRKVCVIFLILLCLIYTMHNNTFHGLWAKYLQKYCEKCLSLVEITLKF